jgi:hypothetical protein
MNIVKNAAVIGFWFGLANFVIATMYKAPKEGMNGACARSGACGRRHGRCSFCNCFCDYCDRQIREKAYFIYERRTIVLEATIIAIIGVLLAATLMDKARKAFHDAIK